MAIKKKTFIAEKRKWGRRKGDFAVRCMLITSLFVNIAMAAAYSAAVGVIQGMMTAIRASPLYTLGSGDLDAPPL